jgi:hypothetical protein
LNLTELNLRMKSGPSGTNSGCGFFQLRRHHRRWSLCAPGNSHGKTPDGRHAAQMERLSVGRTPNKSLEFP